MKATINGIAIEGSPQEIMEYLELHVWKVETKPYTPDNPYSQKIDYQFQPKPLFWSRSVSNKKECPNNGMPCYCTGVCK